MKKEELSFEIKGQKYLYTIQHNLEEFGLALFPIFVDWLNKSADFYSACDLCHYINKKSIGKGAKARLIYVQPLEDKICVTLAKVKGGVISPYDATNMILGFLKKDDKFVDLNEIIVYDYSDNISRF